MAGEPLARIVDAAALDREAGARAVIELSVPASWLRRGGALELTAPTRLRCAACDGGGCDACGKSGAFRLADAPERRTVALVLPAHAPERLRLRLPHPFEGSPLTLLVVEIRVGAPSPGIRVPVAASPRIPLVVVLLVCALVAVLCAIAAALG
jgi:hypothetical protein